jgi:hypothetical protein
MVAKRAVAGRGLPDRILILGVASRLHASAEWLRGVGRGLPNYANAILTTSEWSPPSPIPTSGRLLVWVGNESLASALGFATELTLGAVSGGTVTEVALPGVQRIRPRASVLNVLRLRGICHWGAFPDG